MKEELKNEVQEAEIVASKESEEYATIEPDDIVMDDDSDMPEPETKDYEKYIKCTQKFLDLFNGVVGKMPYASILRNSNGDSIKLIDLVKYVEAKKDKILVNEMDKIISFIANIEFKLARPLMELIEDQTRQSELFQIIQ